MAFANSGMAHFGLIEMIKSSPDKAKNIKTIRVSGINYYYDRANLEVSYNKVNVNASDLKVGMKIRFSTSTNKAEKITKVIIMSKHDSLINH